MEILAKRTIAFVLYPGLTLLDLIGPLEVLSKLGPSYQTILVGECLEPMDTSLPIWITAERTFKEASDPFAIIVPGGSGGAIRAMGDEELIEVLISADKTAKMVGSICTGSLVLASAGLLQGRKATTHWSYAPFLSKLGAEFVKKRWVQDGKYITSAGVSAGIDMALELASQLVGVEVAKKIQLGLEYDPQPPQGAIDWNDVDLDERLPLIKSKMRSELAHRPELLEKLMS